MQRLGRAVTVLTAILVVASVALIGPGLAGLGASPFLAISLGAATGLLYAVRDRLGDVRRVAGVDLGAVLGVAWVGALLAVVLIIAVPGASPGEVQATGGLCGLAGMANYFLRPVYGLVYGTVRRLDRALSGSGQR